LEPSRAADQSASGGGGGDATFGFDPQAKGIDGNGLPGAAEPAPPPPAPRPVRLHSGIDAPRRIVNVAPRYPELARATRVEGIVILEVVIDERGDVVAARVLRSLAVLDDAALVAVRAWKFSPARLNGQPIPIVMTVTINFTLRP
jgi:protein TonB